MAENKLPSAIKKIAWGYLFTFLNINLATVDILPDWVGFIMILSALPVIAEKEESASLLKPLGIILTLWEFAEWATALFGVNINIPVIGIVIGIVRIYFDFQLITNLSALAPEAERKDRLLKLRSFSVVFHTVTTLCAGLFTYFPEFAVYAAFVLIIPQLILTVWLCAELFRLSGAIQTVQNNTENTSEEPLDFSDAEE